MICFPSWERGSPPPPSRTRRPTAREPGPQFQDAIASFKAANSRQWLLQRQFELDLPYELVSSATIEAIFKQVNKTKPGVTLLETPGEGSMSGIPARAASLFCPQSASTKTRRGCVRRCQLRIALQCLELSSVQKDEWQVDRGPGHHVPYHIVAN